MDKKNILTKIKELFNTTESFSYDYKTLDGRILRCYGEELTIGEEIKEITPDGELALEDGEYPLEDGILLTIVGGKIENITQDEEDMEEEVVLVPTQESMAEYLETTLLDGTKARVEGGELVVGAKVEVEIDGIYVNAPEGQHDLVDGVVIYVDADGLVNEIETADTKKEDEMLSQVFNSIKELVDEVKSLKGDIKNIKEENTKLQNRVNKFAAEPSEEPIETKIQFKNTNNKMDKLKFFSK
jgi:hypothetical protein